MSGFITIERDLWKHPVFARSEMTEREAWMWMIANAAWAGTQHRVGADVVEVPRGSFMVTLREMQSAFMWKSDKRVRNFLQKLENHGMLTVQTLGQRNARKTHVTICNYDEYQSGGRSKDAAKTHRGRTTDAVKEQGNKVTREDTNVSFTAKARGTRLSSDWALPLEWGQWALSQGWPEQTIRTEAEKFKDYWTAKSGKDATKLDWLATWRNWMRNCKAPRVVDGGRKENTNAKRPIFERLEARFTEMDCGEDRDPSEPLLSTDDGRADRGSCDDGLDQGTVWLFSGSDQRCM